MYEYPKRKGNKWQSAVLIRRNRRKGIILKGLELSLNLLVLIISIQHGVIRKLNVL